MQQSAAFSCYLHFSALKKKTSKMFRQSSGYDVTKGNDNLPGLVTTIAAKSAPPRDHPVVVDFPNMWDARRGISLGNEVTTQRDVNSGMKNTKICKRRNRRPIIGRLLTTAVHA